MQISVDAKLTAIIFRDDIEKLTKDFTGRTWLFKEIDDWLQKRDNRFFLLTGEPGVGKSAIAAKLTQIRQDVIAASHFCRDRDVETVRPERILRSLAAQLAEKLPDYGQALANSIKPHLLQVQSNIGIQSVSNSQITAVYIENLKPSDPENELDILIRAPFAELQKMYAAKQQQPPNSVVILINSLDEAVNTTGTNIVKLLAKLSKSDLPDWVRFVLTSRRGGEVAQELKELQPYDLEQTSKDNLDDVWQYIQKRVKQPQLQEVLQNNQSTQSIDQIIKQIAELANGNFLYTKLLLDDIETKRQLLDDLSALPKTLNDIYDRWLMRLKEKWEERYQPILGIMTVAQEPLTEKQLVNFTGVDSEYLHNSFPELVQFLNEVKNKENNSTYAIFHRSLRDYLLEEKSDKFFIIAPQKYHNRIIKYYYKEDAQSGEEVNWSKIDEYGLLHLSKHLNFAEKEQELYKLLTASPNWMQEKFIVFSSDLPYIEDLELAMNKFNDPLNSDELLTLTKLYTARLVVQQRANSYQDTDLKTLVWLGRKTEEALSYARLRTNSEQKLTSLMIIANALQDTDQSNSTVLDEAVKIAENEIENNSSLTQALRDLVIALIQAERLTEAEEISNKIRNDSFQKVEVLGELAKALGKSKDLKEAENITKNIDYPYDKFKSLLYLGSTLANNKEPKKAKRLFSEAEKLTEKIDKPLIVTALLNLAKALADNRYTEEAHLIFSKVQKRANAIEDKNNEERLEILRNLATTQAQCGGKFDNKAQFKELQELAYGITENSWTKAQSLLYLANALAKGGKVEQSEVVFSAAIKVPDTFEQGWEMVEKLREFADNLVSSGFTEKAKIYFLQAKESTKDIQGNWQRAEALRYLATALAQNKFIDEAREAFSEAEELAPNIEQGQKSEYALSKWAVILNRAGFSGKVGIICSNADKFEEAQKDIDYLKDVAEESVRKQAKALTFDDANLAKRQYDFLAIDRINGAEYFADVQEIAHTVMKSEEFNSESIDMLIDISIAIAIVGKFSAARKVAYAIEDDLMQIETLIQLATVVAWLGFFKEAFNILGFKNGLIQFLDKLANWIGVSETVEQRLSLEILQETTRIFGWTYPYWGRIYNQLVSISNEADFPNWEKPITSFNNKEKEELYISNIFLDISPEQVQRFESCIQEAIDILYQNIESRELKSLTNIEETVLKQIIQSISTKIYSANSFR